MNRHKTTVNGLNRCEHEDCREVLPATQPAHIAHWLRKHGVWGIALYCWDHGVRLPLIIIAVSSTILLAQDLAAVL